MGNTTSTMGNTAMEELCRASGGSSSSEAKCSSTKEDGITFIFFPELPAELQLKIWSDTLPGPRVVEINHRSGCRPIDFYDGVRSPTDCAKLHRRDLRLALEAFSDPMPLLHACRDSQGLALKLYRLAFSEILSHPVYFDSSQDILLVHNLSVSEDICIHPASLLLADHGVRHLSVDFSWTRIFTHLKGWESAAFWEARVRRTRPLVKAAQKLATVRHLTILTHASDNPDDGSIDEYEEQTREEVESFWDELWALAKHDEQNSVPQSERASLRSWNSPQGGSWNTREPMRLML